MINFVITETYKIKCAGMGNYFDDDIEKKKINFASFFTQLIIST